MDAKGGKTRRKIIKKWIVNTENKENTEKLKNGKVGTYPRNTWFQTKRKTSRGATGLSRGV